MKLLSLVKSTIRSSIGLRNDTDFYSQGGEDAIVSNTFVHGLGISNGRYVDIGAYHPFKHSNTFLLYRAGWQGINFDPRPGTKALFDKHRSRDTNIEAGVAGENGTLTYYFIGEDSTMNTFSKDNLERLGMLDKVKQMISIPVFSLRTVMEQYPRFKDADYLNIDAEGFELEILRGNDFTRFNPKVISIEQNEVSTLSDVLKSETAKFLDEQDYVPYAKNILLATVSTVFYIRNGLFAK